jgi:SAM-dependent methyltransferase
MTGFRASDWYRFPRYYDAVFDQDTRHEADFLEAVLARIGPAIRARPAHLLEPACGTGRLVIELARRGHRVTGFDAGAEMIAYARERARAEPPRVRRAIRLHEARMESFRLRGPFDLAYCLLSTIKHLASEEAARAHLQRVAAALAPGGLCVAGLHLTDYTRTRTDREVWRGSRDGVSVVCETITRPPDATTRTEWLRNRLTVRHRGRAEVERLETTWPCRTYDAAQLRRLLDSVPSLELAACFDFRHDIDAPRGFDDTQEDIVVVARKRPPP